MFELIKPHTNFDFIGKTKIFVGLSVVSIFVSLLLIIFVKPNYGIDFKGGTNVVLLFHQDVDPAAVGEAMRDLGFDDAVVQRFGTAADRHMFAVQTNRISVISPEKATQLQEALADAFGTEGLDFSYSPDSGDSIEVVLPETAFASLPDDTAQGTGEGTGAATNDNGASPHERRLAEFLHGAGLENANVTQIGNPVHNRFLIRLQELQPRIAAGMIEAFGPEVFSNVERVETVGSKVGGQMRDQAIKALLLSMLFIMVYVALRFNFRFAPGAVVALFHDAIFTLGVFVALQVEVDLTILAALLTIIGFSMNDTIVVYDRIRELLGNSRTKDLRATVNRAVNDTLSRTILTSGTVLMTSMAIWLVGGGMIRDFGFAMVIGTIVGTYSSIFIASPVMIWLTEHSEARNARSAAERSAAPVKRTTTGPRTKSLTKS